MTTHFEGGVPTAPKTYSEQHFSSYRLDRLRKVMEYIREAGLERITAEDPETYADTQHWRELHLLSTGAHYKQIFSEDLLTTEDLSLLKPGLEAQINTDLEKPSLDMATHFAVLQLVLYGDKSWSHEQEFAMFRDLENKLALTRSEAERRGPLGYGERRFYRNQEDVAKMAYRLRVLVGKSHRDIDWLVRNCVDYYGNFAKEQMERDAYLGDAMSGGEPADHAAYHAAYSRVLAAQNIEIIPGEGIRITD